jgi:hypothetical protein
MNKEEVTQMPHVTLTLMADMVQEVGEFMHMPLVIESWPPGLNVEMVLAEALRMIREEGWE